MRFVHPREWFRTLRFRLLAWNVLVVILMVIPTLVAAREGLRYALIHEFDQVLEEDALEIGLALQRFYPNLTPLYDELNRKAEGHAHHGWFVQLLGASGGVLWTSKNAPEVVFESRLENSGSWSSIGSYRLLYMRLDTPKGDPVAVRIGSSLRSVHEDVALLTRMMIVAGMLILVLAPLGGYWLAGRATQPIAAIIDTAMRLRPDRLDERLPVRDTGDELDRLSTTINGLLDRIGAYLAQNRDFVANAAHELRSPLAAIRNSVEVTLNSERSKEEYVNVLADIMEECDDVNVLVNQLLLLAESAAGEISLGEKWVSFDRVVRKSLSMFEGVAEAKEVAIKIGAMEAAHVRGDEYYLMQIANNLIDNAIKFTPPGGTVSVDLNADAKKGVAILRVADTGVGIATEDLPRIFERFYRADKSRQREERSRGTGLGLSICAMIVEMLQGTIQVRSAVGKGSEFVVALPVCGLAPSSKSDFQRRVAP